MVSGPSFFVDGPSKDEIDAAIALARQWAVQLTDPVEGGDYSAKQNAIWAQAYITSQTLDDHADVNITAPADGDRLVYNSGNSKWVNEPIAPESVAYTPGNTADWNLSTNGNTVPTTIYQALDLLAAQIKSMDQAQGDAIPIAVSDETTAITAGTSKTTFRVPVNFRLSAVTASLTTAQVSGSPFTVDVNRNGTSLLTAPIAFANTSETASGTVTVTQLTALTDEITVDVDVIGNGTAKGLKVYLIGRSFPPYT